MGSNEQALEAEIQAQDCTAPRLTPEQIDAVIDADIYLQPAGTTLTICILRLKNGFTVVGESASASPENFRPEIGEKVAYENARSKIWALEGYLLRQKLHEFRSFSTEPSVNLAAVMAHELNRIWCAILGDFSQPAWVDAPGWQVESALAGVRFHQKNPDAGDSASHDCWLEQKRADGWVYGPVKDPAKKEHPCMVPFEDLPKEQQMKDSLFRAVVRAVLENM